MSSKIKIGISSCLLGNNVRYDGGHKLAPYLKEALGQFVEWVPVCPEVESGLPVPREAMRLIGSLGTIHLLTIETGVDHTTRLITWARNKAALLEQEQLSGFIFKARSPSCGIDDSEIFQPSGHVAAQGPGIFAKVFREHFPAIPVEDENRLQDPAVRKNFFERASLYARKHV